MDEANGSLVTRPIPPTVYCDTHGHVSPQLLRWGKLSEGNQFNFCVACVVEFLVKNGIRHHPL